MKKSLLCVVFLLSLSSLAGCAQPRTVNVTVVGDDGTPIENARVRVAYMDTRNDDDKEGLTNQNGVFTARGKADFRILVIINKEGYYQTRVDRLSPLEDHDLTLTLREKRNPIPLYAKKVVLFMPANRQWIGYDFEIGDWLPPYGIGKKADVSFRCDTEMTDPRNGRGNLEVKFAEGAGILLVEDGYLKYSEMYLPHHAPHEGYNSLLTRFENSYHNENRIDNVGYFFKTRVVKRGGKVISANFGKILEDFTFGPRHAHLLMKDPQDLISYATVRFTYYFNPTPNDRNLEFDPSQNLFNDLENRERVNQP
ncbi:MAG: carboxypeptidase regulatory-like domain-containing protein [Verrucomicrobia bacterium]|nr:carboxypeptidase regulatory-like domain-containing protein [Verrucomicrobiota bacterium]